MTPPLDLDEKREQIKKYATVALVMVVAAIAYPVAILAMESMAALMVTAAAVLVAWGLAPAVTTYIANQRIALLKAAIEANPIETMENLFAEKTSDLLKADGDITKFGVAVRNFDDQVDGFKRDYPAEAPAYIELSRRMHEALDSMKTRQSAARMELAKFGKEITKAHAIYEMANAANTVVKMSKSAESQIFAKIRQTVAFDAIRTSLNTAFENLDLAIARQHDEDLIANAATTADQPKQIASPAITDETSTSSITPVASTVTISRGSR